MKKPEIIINDSNFASNSLSDGRIAKDYLKQLTTTIFKNSITYFKKYYEWTNEYEFPLLFNERKLYSIYASAINSLSPIHLSEWGFSKHDINKLDANRRVDFWTKFKRKENSRTTNFFIELKTGGYCLNKRASGNITKPESDKLDSLIKQLRTLRVKNPNWDGNNDVNIGMIQIYGYYKTGKEMYTYEDLNSCVRKTIDKRTVKNYLVSTILLPDDMKTRWEIDKCRFVSIYSMII